MKTIMEMAEQSKLFQKTNHEFGIWNPDYLEAFAKLVREEALAQPEQEPVAWPAGLIDRIKAAEQRIQDGHSPRRIPADPTDVDLVLAEVRSLLEGEQPPFWIKTTPPAAPVQEPVAWPCVIAEADFEQNTVTLEMQCSDYEVRAGQHWLYTTPPQEQK